MKSKALLFVIAMIAMLNVDGVASKKGPKTPGLVSQSSLSGLILDKDSNEKLAGVMIQISSTDQKIYSDSRGEFNLDSIQPGTYNVKINCISYEDKEVTVKITKPQTEKLKILLSPVRP